MMSKSALFAVALGLACAAVSDMCPRAAADGVDKACTKCIQKTCQDIGTVQTANPQCGRCIITGSLPAYFTRFDATRIATFYRELPFSCSGICTVSYLWWCTRFASSCGDRVVANQNCPPPPGPGEEEDQFEDVVDVVEESSSNSSSSGSNPNGK